MALLFANTVLRDESSNQNSLTDLVDLSNQRNESFGSAVNVRIFVLESVIKHIKSKFLNPISPIA